MPPGTGDVQLSICQSVPVQGAIVVTTPQAVALSDVRRGIEMLNKMKVINPLTKKFAVPELKVAVQKHWQCEPTISPLHIQYLGTHLWNSGKYDGFFLSGLRYKNAAVWFRPGRRNFSCRSTR